MAAAVDFKEVFGRKGCIIYFLTELKWNNGILTAVDDQNGSADFLQPGLRIELPTYKKADAREKPINLAGDSRSGWKRGLKHHTRDLAVDCQVSGDCGSEGLTEGNDRFGVGTFCVHEVFVGRFGIAVDASFARLSFAVTVTAVFQGKYVCMCAAEKFIDGRAVGDVGGVAVKGQESKSRLVARDPPRVELDTVRGREPNVFYIQTTRMPVAGEAAGIVRVENSARFEHADDCQGQEIGEKVPQEATVPRFS